ncbi:MAG: NUDIX hydrolase [Prolixibacteraceae bacterium]|nr:NUDIX hydrolase [Prolixibacteraceae bacterium]
MTYTNHEKFLIAVDCVIFGYSDGFLKLLLYKRDFEPEKGNWSLMGGFLSCDETLDMAAYRVLARITGLRNIYMEQLGTFSEVKRDKAARVISTAYYSLINLEEYDQAVLKKHGVEWFSIDELPGLIFDHDEIVQKALKRLKRKAKSEPIGFELLPEKFTITQLRNLYEAIYQRELDPGNFRRKLMSMDLLDRLPYKDMNSSKKGAYLYAFNKEKYEILSGNGFSFDLAGV